MKEDTRKGNEGRKMDSIVAGVYRPSEAIRLMMVTNG